MAIFLYNGFVKNIPKKIEEAASDGCSPLQTFSGHFPDVKADYSYHLHFQCLVDME